MPEWAQDDPRAYCRSMPPIGSTMEPLPSSLTSSGGWRRTCGRFGFRT